MNLILSLNPEKGETQYKEEELQDNKEEFQKKLSRDWKEAEWNVENEEEVARILSQYSYSPHIWKYGRRNGEYYEYTPSCVIGDMDDGLSILEAKTRFAEFQYILITTKSHQREKGAKPPCDRYRIILPLSEPITDPQVYKDLRDAQLFAGFDKQVFDDARYFYPSPENCLVEIKYDGKLFNPQEIEYDNIISKAGPANSIKPPKTVSSKAGGINFTRADQKQFKIEDLQRIRTHCQPMNEAFESIEGKQGAGNPSHVQRIAVGNIIQNTVDDTTYLHDLFQNAQNYNRETTQKHYESLSHRPITCKTMQGYGLCKAQCQLMKDLGKKSPIAFGYRTRPEQLKKTDELLPLIDDADAFRELLMRAREHQDSIVKDDLVKRMSALKGLARKYVEKIIDDIDISDDPEFQEKCSGWWRIGDQFYEAVRLPFKRTYDFTKRGVTDVKKRLGKDAENYIITEKSLHGSISITKLGGGLYPLSYRVEEDEIRIYHEIPKVNKPNSGRISAWLEDRFRDKVDFIKQWIAMYTYSNFVQLPVLIFTGDRGVGKSVFMDFISAIYPSLTCAFIPDSNFTEHYEAKFATIDEAHQLDNTKLYQAIKQIGGAESLPVNVKHGRKYSVPNNLNLIILSNSRIPVYLNSNEKPVDSKNNQFFVYHMPPLTGPINNGLKTELLAEQGSWLRGEIKEIYESLKKRPDASEYRYTINVPITQEELCLFDNNTTDIELFIEEEIIEKLPVAYLLSKDLKAIAEGSPYSRSELCKKMAENGMLKVAKTATAPKKGLYNISNIQQQTSQRYYDFTSAWQQMINVRNRKRSAKPQAQVNTNQNSITFNKPTT